jgi:hypothetical protein
MCTSGSASIAGKTNTCSSPAAQAPQAQRYEKNPMILWSKTSETVSSACVQWCFYSPSDAYTRPVMLLLAHIYPFWGVGSAPWTWGLARPLQPADLSIQKHQAPLAWWSARQGMSNNVLLHASTTHTLSSYVDSPSFLYVFFAGLRWSRKDTECLSLSSALPHSSKSDKTKCLLYAHFRQVHVHVCTFTWYRYLHQCLKKKTLGVRGL